MGKILSGATACADGKMNAVDEVVAESWENINVQ